MLRKLFERFIGREREREREREKERKIKKISMKEMNN